MSNTRTNPESTAPTARSVKLTTAGVIAAYVHEISGRHQRDDDAAKRLSSPSSD